MNNYFSEHMLSFMRRTADKWPDKLYLRLYHLLMTGTILHLKNPKTYSEKCQWMKLYYQRPELTQMADKYEVKKYVADRIGEKYIVDCYGVWDSFDDIDFEKLPNQFVLKGTGSSGAFVICKDKSTFNMKEARELMMMDVNRNFYYSKREWVYKNIKPRIIAERYLDSLLKEDTIEYKITCMNGRVEFVTICGGVAHGRYEDRFNDHFTRDWKRMNWYARYKPTGKDYQKTPEIEQMMELSEKLSEGIPQVRVDWYLHNGKIYFGEFTFYTWAGWPLFTPKEWDLKLGENFKLPAKKYIEDK